MADTDITQAIDIARNHFPTSGNRGVGLRVNIDGWSRGGVTIPGDLASGGPGGKIGVGRARSPFPLAIFFQPFGVSGFFGSLKSRGEN